MNNKFLNYNKCIKNKKITKENTLIILDWDDTLFPTTWVMKNGIDVMNFSLKERFIKIFTELDNILSELLVKLQNYGDVVIITNALPVWVKVSSSTLPKTNKILNGLKIVSARKNYKYISSNMMDWKKLAFKNEITQLINKHNFLNIISVGDAEYEYIALVNLYKATNTDKLLKSIKLMDHPSNEILIDQLKVLTKVIPNVCLNDNHLDLKFKLK